MKSKEEQNKLKQELAELNAAVDVALEARTKWMDDHMEDFAIAKPGEMLYRRDGDNFVRLGTVRQLYRYHAGQNRLYDTRMSVEYKYEPWPHGGCLDNTSSQGFLWLANEADEEAHQRCKYEELSKKFSCA